MSTPEWPVPYWQRIYRHDPAPEQRDTWNPNQATVEINDAHVIMAKEMLKTKGLGYVVEAVENHLDLGKPVNPHVGKGLQSILDLEYFYNGDVSN